MQYDDDMGGTQKLMSSDYLVKLIDRMNIKNDGLHSFEALPS